jgi:hypothetical protein
MNTRTAVITGITGLMLSVGTAATTSAQSARYGYTSSTAERQAERIVRRAYRDILRREPDASGLRQYTEAMLYNKWSEADVRRSLMSSDEYANRGLAYRSSRDVARSSYRGAYANRYLNRAGAESMVRSAYRSVLGREPDATGMRDYTNRVLRDGWTERDIARSLRSSSEYRYRR